MNPAKASEWEVPRGKALAFAVLFGASMAGVTYVLAAEKGPSPLRLVLIGLALLWTAPLEEWLFRDLLFSRLLLPRVGFLPATMVSSAIFALAHGRWSWPRVSVGILLCFWYVRTRSLSSCSIAHATHNAMLCTISLLQLL